MTDSAAAASTVPLPTCPGFDFRGAVWSLVERLRPGETTSYGAVAKALGEPQAAKAVASELLGTHDGDGCPCHRVTRQNEAGLWAHGGTGEKTERLAGEGVLSLSGSRVELPREDRFSPLREWQSLAATAARSVRPRVDFSKHVVAVDVSYAESTAVAACVRWTPGGVADDTIALAQVRDAFPYVSGYLAFRELPAMTAAVERYHTQFGCPTVIVVDGSGRLHPREAGVASCLAAVLQLPTVGVTKRHLRGTVVDATASESPISVDGETWGTRFRFATRRSKKPIELDVSPGGGGNAAEAANLIRSMLDGHRLPAGLRDADRLSRFEARRLLCAPAARPNEDSKQESVRAPVGTRTSKQSSRKP